MPPATRHLSLALVLLLVFIAAALAAQFWLERETRHLQTEGIAAKRAQFLKALEVLPRPPAEWDAGYERTLGAILGATVTLRPANPAEAAAARAAGQLAFDQALPGNPALAAHVTFAPPPTGRLFILHQWMIVAVLLLALLFLLIAVLLSLPRRGGVDGSAAPFIQTARRDMRDLEQLARISVERGEALARESGARHRAEEDLELSRTLLGQSRDERVRLGRELHDNLCQTLYAVSLTLEGVRGRLAPGAAGNPAERIDQCVAELRRLNHEVRVYLKGLEPDTMQRQRLVEALDAMLDAQVRPESIRLVRDIDEEATALIPPDQAAEVVNLLREAVSNSLKHSRARTLSVHARRGDGCVVFAVHDDGLGFDPAAAVGQGHGLANMQARAEALGGSVQVVSGGGKGTRVLLTLPVTSAA
ncbi:MAG TPA: ATP-binding protein [Opitutaceae bacterium]|nr:ATP-binding protein [Opitutaceae bacterium]